MKVSCEGRRFLPLLDPCKRKCSVLPINLFHFHILLGDLAALSSLPVTALITYPQEHLANTEDISAMSHFFQNNHDPNILHKLVTTTDAFLMLLWCLQ
jgi:hypothetical protein